MINPSLNCNKLFREKVENLLSFSYHKKALETIRDCLRKNNTCVMALMMFYDNNVEKPKKWYKVLICVVYSLIDNYVCIDYLSRQSKISSSVSSKPTL